MVRALGDSMRGVGEVGDERQDYGTGWGRERGRGPGWCFPVSSVGASPGWESREGREGRDPEGSET